MRRGHPHPYYGYPPDGYDPREMNQDRRDVECSYDRSDSYEERPSSRGRDGGRGRHDRDSDDKPARKDSYEEDRERSDKSEEMEGEN